jgi:hypothetical protein
VLAHILKTIRYIAIFTENDAADPVFAGAICRFAGASAGVYAVSVADLGVPVLLSR